MPSRIIFAPRSYQREPQTAMRQGCKRFVDVWHRRGGKDKTWLNIELEESQKRKGIYYHIFPSLNQGRRDLWDNIGSDGIAFMDMFPNELVARNGRNQLEMQVTFRNGSIWQIMGADDKRSIERMRGANPRGLVYSEYGNMDVSAWDTLSPVLTENGGWAAFIYTPPKELPTCCVTGDPLTNRCRGNHAKLRYEMAAGDSNWHCSLKTVDDTFRDAEGEAGGPVISAEALAEERIEHSSDSHYIDREYYCKFDAPVQGSYYGDLLDEALRKGRIGYVEYNPTYPVHIGFDLGAKSITMAVGAFQTYNASIRWLAAWSDIGRGLPQYARALREGTNFIFGTTYMPHDGNQHEAGTGKTRAWHWRNLGFRKIHIVRKLNPADGISTVQRMMPMMYFNRETCGPLLHSLKHYHEEHGQPVHDGTSHYADMVRYVCVGIKEPAQTAPGEDQTPRFARTDHDPYGRNQGPYRYARTDSDPYGRR